MANQDLCQEGTDLPNAPYACICKCDDWLAKAEIDITNVIHKHYDMTQSHFRVTGWWLLSSPRNVCVEKIDAIPQLMANFQ